MGRRQKLRTGDEANDARGPPLVRSDGYTEESARPIHVERQSLTSNCVGGRGNGLAVALALILAALESGVTALPADAASCNEAAQRQVTLMAGTGSPGSGTPSTMFAFSVRYADLAGPACRRRSSS